MKFVPKGSLRHYFSAPQFTPQDLSKTTTPFAAERIKKYWVEQVNNAAAPRPDPEAVEFYCLNHLASIIRSNFDYDEELPKWAQETMDRYVDVVSNQGQRLYAYMVLIITRESRHLKNISSIKPMDVTFKGFHSQIKGQGSISVAEHFCAQPPAISLGIYLKSIVDVFNKGGFSGGYGGPPWGRIAHCVHQMITGVTTIEMMVDSAYCLAHNNGPMFNKGMLYTTNGNQFIKILDIQRSGQIPEAIRHGELHPTMIKTHLKPLVMSTVDAFPNAIGEFVDWQKVENSNSVHKYPTEKAAQPKKVKPAIKVPGGKFVFVPTGEQFSVPGNTIEVVKREAA